MRAEGGFPWGWVLAVIVIGALFAAWRLLPVADGLQQFNQWVAGLGVIGWLIFGVAYIVATVLLMPGAPLTIAAGLAFGLIGALIVIPAATVGATLAYLVARYLARDRVKRRFVDSQRFQAIDRAIAEDGWKIVGLLRLSPLVPFNLQNYLYGITDIKLVPYMLATFFGIMPGTLLYVYFGAAGKAALSGGAAAGGGVAQWALFGVGLVATLAVTVLVTRKAKAKLDALGVAEESA